MAPLKGRRGTRGSPPCTRNNATRTNATSSQNPTESKLTTQAVCASTFVPSTYSLPFPPNSHSQSRTKSQIKAKAEAMPATTTRRASSFTPSLNSSSSKPSPGTTLERNVDNVVLGDVLFRAWYPSRHVKEVVGREVVDGKEMLERLYVCKHCFKYSKELMGWVSHGKTCERRAGGTAPMVPGLRIYSHGNSAWSVWEVDGEVDTLYCQNLCLFAKLFLDNKSVFFDVTGFIYLLLVHTNPTTGEQQVIGFFSKEKMSWDNNNLACILIFPPWQRKGLGALLIAVSYEISRREKTIGGPEKPISDLGKMGYIKYWSSEVARYLLDVEADRKNKGVVSLDDISTGTWICVEDCLAALKHMNIAVAAGVGKGEVQRVRIDKERLREWTKTTKTSLEPILDPEGFLPGYGYREESVDDDMEE